MIHIDTIIIGAGPAGLQLGYFLQRGNHEYLILERNEKAGSFFSKYPHTGKLISINKKYTGRDDPEFNLRHDWNSLLCDDPTFRFTSYSDDYYPDHKDLVRYLNDFAEKYKLNIKYNTAVESINKEFICSGKVITNDVKYIINTSDNIYSCNRLVIATGLSKPVLPNINENICKKIKHYAEYEKGYFKDPDNLEKYKNKIVGIIGSGNSAYELANQLMPYCSHIVIFSRNNKPFSIVTNYTGDLRALYLPFKESFLLKSLSGEVLIPPMQLSISQDSEDSKYFLKNKCLNKDCNIIHDIIPELNGYDEFIYCTGWKFDSSIFNFSVFSSPSSKYPKLNFTYESIDNKKLYFIGSLMHEYDYKKSSGGFIHGFRYLIEFFYMVNYIKEIDTTIFDIDNKDNLKNHILYRINNISSLYQMYGVLSDIFYLCEDSNSFNYHPSINKLLLNSKVIKSTKNYYFVLTLEFGNEKNSDMYSLGKKLSDIGTESRSTLLHPIINIFNKDKKIVDTIHFDEDILANFTDTKRYSDKLDRVLLLLTESS